MPHFSAVMRRNLLRPVHWCLLQTVPLTPLALPVLLLPTATAVAQQNTITIGGTVRDAAGQPVELVGVGVEGQAGGTSTDSQGRFTLRVPRTGRPAVLVVRGLRFKPLRVPLTLSQDSPRCASRCRATPGPCVT